MFHFKRKKEITYISNTSKELIPTQEIVILGKNNKFLGSIYFTRKVHIDEIIEHKKIQIKCVPEETN